MTCVDILKLIAHCINPKSQTIVKDPDEHYPSIQETKKLELNGTMKARLVKIYDGDTQTYVVKLNQTFYNVVVRVSGIDTPEIRSKNKVEVARGIHARNRAFEILTGLCVGIDEKGNELNKKLDIQPYYVTLLCQGSDKYGRQLAIIKNQYGVDLGKKLIEERLALPYDGDKKTEFVASNFS